MAILLSYDKTVERLMKGHVFFLSPSVKYTELMVGRFSVLRLSVLLRTIAENHDVVFPRLVAVRAF